MIDIKQILDEKGMSIRECSIYYDIPYTTLHSIVNGKVKIEDCKYSTAKKISRFIGIPMESLTMENSSFEYFRSSLHHDLKRDGKMEVYKKIIMNKQVEAYMLHNQYVKALYLVSLLEYIENSYRLQHSDIRARYETVSLKKPFYFGNKNKKDDGKYIIEFKKHNIMEGDLYDAI